MGIPDQVYECLDNAVFENDYPHEYDRSAKDIVLEIHDWSGIEGFNLEFPGHLAAGIAAVNRWRQKNPRPTTS